MFCISKVKTKQNRKRLFWFTEFDDVDLKKKVQNKNDKKKKNH